ncbi:NAD(P)/FAD-dependent oxidoreductase [Halotalea alkalilenta]|uniref:NAD(P)/FAD-dependent oxidoreductase n=1 Tax=Halotalea alkalilenta TaxID=376489 RepID=UPI0004811893|nr:FAD-dependent oxidoreductase [Halotalea alkalilenta]
MIESLLDYDVAIIGAGPAGLAAAIELKHQGVARVAVLERDAEAGGIPRHCGHPPFGMREYRRVLSGPAYARRNVERARAAGVELRLRHSVVALGEGGVIDAASPEGQVRIVAKRVLLATGARETPRSTRLISGDRPFGVINTGALQSYLYLERLKPFSRPLIVGSELVALSALLSCRRTGIKPVLMIEQAEKPLARWPLALFPRLCGVPFECSTRLESIEGRERVEAAWIRGSDEELRRIDCDGVLLTGRFVPESSLVRLSHLELDAGSGGPMIDQYGRCSDPAYFAAGNLLRPIETAGWSYREGRRIAALIARDLTDPLPRSHPGIRLQCLPPIRFCVPQRLVTPIGDGLAHLQLRTERPAKGILSVRGSAGVVWQRQVHLLPERRILIPLDRLRLAAGESGLTIELEENRERSR